VVKEVEEVTSKKQIRDKCKVIHQLAHKHLITVLCKIAKVSRSGYYKWIYRQGIQTPKDIEDNNIKELITICHQKYKGIYGYKRVTIWLKRDTRGVILHSDRGFQYTSRRYNNLIKVNNMSASMSRKGNCLDNACIESFFGHLKSELFHFKNFNSAKEVISAVKKYIHFYNNERFQSKLNNLTPIEYRNQVA
jgi:transposase InsO family protein